uniref:Tail protein n=1 Tax=viral metagenome TaxID=1070528 RepID=A0A6C0LM54_9ZZZZ
MSGFSTVKNNNQMGSVALQAAQNAVSKATIGMLRNVDAVAADDNNALLYNASNEKWETKSLTSIPTVIPQNVADLKDVSTTAPTNGQVLKYISGTGLWTPGATGALSADLGDLGDVDVATLPAYDGASIQYNGTNWVTSPSDSITIWVASGANGGDNVNSGLNTGAAVADMPTAFQKAFQKGSVVSSKINLKLADVPWDTSTRNLYNTNLLNGPSFTTFNVNGSSQDFSVADGGGTSRTTGASLTGYAIQNLTGQTISNGWNCTTFPTTIYWGEVTINGAVKTLPILVDDQTQNTGARVYFAYWDYSTGTGFTSTPTFTERQLVDSTVLTNSASFYGPMSFTNIIIKCPDAGEVKFLNDVSMQYAQVSSTTPDVLTNITYVGKNTKCSFCRFTDVTFSCRGTSLTVSGMTGTTFINCIFYNCSFIEADNVSFVGCIFYRNPTLFSSKAARVVMQACTFIYSHGSGVAALADITSGGHLELESGVVDLQQYASGHDPLTKPVFKADTNSNILLDNINVLDGVLDTSSSIMPPLVSVLDECSFAIVRNKSYLKAKNVRITDTNAGTYPIFVARETSTIHVIEGDYKVNEHYFITAGNGSTISLSNLIDKIQCSQFIIADRSFINIDHVIIRTGGTYTISGNFLNTVSCEVKAGGGPTFQGIGIYVDLDHSNTKNLIYDEGSKIYMLLQPDNLNNNMYGKISLQKTQLIIKTVAPNFSSSLRTINLRSVGSNSVTLSSQENSTVFMDNISVSSELSGCIKTTHNSNTAINFTTNEPGDPNNINCLDADTITASFNSNIYIRGSIGNIKNTGDTNYVINCFNNSEVYIESIINNTNFSVTGWKTILERDSNGVGTAPIINIKNNSKVSFINDAIDKTYDSGGSILNSAPEILLKGESTNDGMNPISIINNSIMIIENAKLTFNKLNGPCLIHNGSKISLLQCVIIDDSGSDERLSYFNPIDSEIAINGTSNFPVFYTPMMLVRAKDDANQGLLRGSNSKFILADMDIQNQTVVGTNQTVIVAENGSSVSYLNPKKIANLGFATGVQLRSNSLCVYKDAGSDQLDCTQDLLLGLLSGSIDTQRKLVDMGGGETIIPKQTGLADYNALKAFIDAAEGCSATIKI